MDTASTRRTCREVVDVWMLADSSARLRERSHVVTLPPATGTTARRTCCGSANGPATSTAHVEFLRGVSNPIGCKVGPSMTGEDVSSLCDALNPAMIPGRLTLITRMGADRIEDGLRPLLSARCANPDTQLCGHATRCTATRSLRTTAARPAHFDAVVAEIEGFVRAHRAEGTWPGGIHVELTGDDVTECLGGSDAIDDLDDRYETICDPRLNARQGLDLAFRTAEVDPRLSQLWVRSTASRTGPHRTPPPSTASGQRHTWECSTVSVNPTGSIASRHCRR